MIRTEYKIAISSSLEAFDTLSPSPATAEWVAGGLKSWVGSLIIVILYARADDKFRKV